MLELYRRLKSDYGYNYYWALKWESRKLGISVEEIEKIVQSYDNLLRETRLIGRQIAELPLTFGEDGTSALNTYIIIFERPPVSMEAVQLLAEDIWPATRCMHEYDCCGHWYSYAPHVEQLGPCTFRITQGTYQNV